MKKILLSLFFLLSFMVLPSDSKVSTEQERLARGEVVITTTARGFSAKFILEGNAQSAWTKLADPESWGKVFDFVLSSHGMKRAGKADVNARGRYTKYRNLYIKGMFRGRMLRMLFNTQISGYSPVTAGSKATPTKAPLKKGLSRSSYGRSRPSYFRGGSLSLTGPTNNISGSPFIQLTNFVTISLSMRSTRMMVKGRYTSATQVTIQVKLDYQKLFLADGDVSLFRLDYRSSEFDRQIRIGLNKIASDFRKSLKN